MDDELIEALLNASDEDFEAVVMSLPDDSVQPLLGMLGSGGDEESMPTSVLEQAQELDPGYLIRPHLQYLSDVFDDAIDRVEAGEDVKILVAMPPRHGKTELTSVYLPLYLLRRNHKTKIGIVSHSPNLAAAWGRRVRRMVERHGATLGLSIAADAGAVSEWETVEGGGVMSRSIGQALAGVGFNVLIIDDPTRDFAAAHSEAARQAVWDWYRVNAITRLEPPSLVIVVQTRWHEDDLSGRLLNPEMEGATPEEWETVILPAIADHNPEKGETDPLGREVGEPLLSPLVKDDTPAKALERLQGLMRSVGSYAAAALYQQRPAPAAGAIFNSSWWRFWTVDPERATPDGKVRYFDPKLLASARIIDSWDMTFKATQTSDYVVGQRWAIVGANRILLAQWRERASFTRTLKQMVTWLKPGADSPYAGQVHERLVEDKANGSAIINTLQDKIAGLIAISPKESKEARARAVTPDIEAGNVYLPLEAEAEWVRAFIDEARSFPSGKNDDQVDAMTQLLARVRQPGRAAIVSPNSPNRGKATPRNPAIATRRGGGAGFTDAARAQRPRLPGR